MDAVANQAGAVQALLTAVDAASSGSSALCKSLALLKDLLEADSGKQAFAEASGAQQLRIVLRAASGADSIAVHKSTCKCRHNMPCMCALM